MSAAPAAPFGMRVIFHPSGEPRLASYSQGVASGYATALYTGTPVSIDPTTGMLILTPVASPCVGIFTGCQFISGNRPFILPYWPAGQTYDANTQMTAWVALHDSGAILEGQANGPIVQTQAGEAINMTAGSTGSIYTGRSSQALNATTTGATPGTFILLSVAPYPDNVWGDAFTIVRVRMQPLVAIA